jgi:hypothetical protein
MSSLAYVKSNIGGYFFDVTFKETHSFENVITENPVQSGTNINDHVYQKPVTITLDIGVSDCLASIATGQFASSSSRSVSAFNVLKSLWQTAQVLTVNTLFDSYTNMIIKSFVPVKDKTTMTALRATVILQQIIVTDAVSISLAQKISSSPQTTAYTATGAKTIATNTIYKTLTISPTEYTGGTVKYSGATMTLDAFFKKYSAAGAAFNLKNYIITPIITASITVNSTFNVGGKTLNYAQFISKYGTS